MPRSGLIGMEPEINSQLTLKYAIGEIIDVPSAIANELFVVDRIFKNTRYIHIIEHVMRVVALNIKETYRLSWTDAWDITRFHQRC